MAGKLTLFWEYKAQGERALVFAPETWAMFEKAAALKGTTADHMIVAAVAEAFGTVLMDSYQENRGRKQWPTD
jgi:hypothetical protein